MGSPVHQGSGAVTAGEVSQDGAIPELVVISGKGGTGKTSVAASLSVLAGDAVTADCDVDAADLHIVLPPKIVERHVFKAGYEASIRRVDCDACGVCLDVCRFDAVRLRPGPVFEIEPLACEGCGVCVRSCPMNAIDFEERTCGEWFVSDTSAGPMVHARLGIAAENSGKLVSTVREQARRVAVERGRRMILVDGPPGIGCPVIASITGATAVLVVAEPSVSGEHDLERVLSLTRHFGISAMVCVNRWDLSEEATERIERQARESGAQSVGRIRYDPAVTEAQIRERAVVELGGGAADDIRGVWERLRPTVDGTLSLRAAGA